MTSLTDLFKSERTLAEHVEAHAADATGYRDEVLSLVRSGVALASGTKARAAALLWAVERLGSSDSVRWSKPLTQREQTWQCSASAGLGWLQ